MVLYQVSSNNSRRVKFDPIPGVTSFIWDYIGKTLEISLYLPQGLGLLEFVCSFIKWASTKSAQGIALGSNLARPRGHKCKMGLYRETLLNFPLPSHKAYQILHVALSSEPLPRVPKS